MPASSGSRMRSADLTAAAVLVVFGLVVAFVVVPAQTSIGFGGTGGLSSAFMPTLAALTVSGLGALLALSLLRRRTDGPKAEEDADGRRVLLTAATTVACVLVFEFVGALVAIALLAAATAAILGERRPVPLVLLTGGTTAFFHVFVERLLGMPLP